MSISEKDFQTNCEVVLGFNSKQWWVYNCIEDIYIDPPVEVLKKIEDATDDLDKQEELLNCIITKCPDWLFDKDYWYDAEDYDI